MGAAITEFAPAKVNLCLHVTGKREDGYHLLDSLVVFAQVGDRLSAEPAIALTLTIGGPFGAGLTADTDNLVLRAAAALAERLPGQPGAALHLEKNLPIASGIGGGSADAAAALRALARLWDIPAGLCEELPAIALQLGADVPVCLDSQATRMRGIGAELDPLSLPEFGMVLVNPLQAVPTGAVFRGLSEHAGFVPSRPITLGCMPDAASLADWLDRTSNDLQTPAIALCPAIQTVLDALHDTQGCLLARMSGSGATCFALYATPHTARRAAEAVSRPGWWSWGG